MRKWVPLVLALALVPVLAPRAAAQKVPPVKSAPNAQPGDDRPGVISLDQARTAALTRVGQELQSGSIAPWKGKAPSGLKVVSASQSNLGGKAAYIVAVMMMKSTGIVRVTLDAKTGAVIDHQLGAGWDWGNAPAWFKAGLNSPPPAKTNSPPPARR